MNLQHSLIASAILAVALSAPLAPAANAQEQPIEMKASMFLPPASSFNKGIDKWIAEVHEKSKGKLKISVFPGSQMGPPPRQFDLVRTGVADFGLVLHGLTPGRFTLTELAHLPGAITSGYVGSRALAEVGPEILKADHPGVKILHVGTISPMPVISKKEVSKASDLKGTRIRAAGSVQSAVLEALGSVPVLIQPGEMNEALTKGMIDGASVGYSGMVTFHLTDAGKFVFEGDLGSVTFAFVMNQASYDKLPPDLKKVIDETSGANGNHFMARALEEEEQTLRAKYQKEGIKIQRLTDDGPLREASAKIRETAIKTAEAKGLPAKEFLDKLKAATEKYKDANYKDAK